MNPYPDPSSSTAVSEPATDYANDRCVIDDIIGEWRSVELTKITERRRLRHCDETNQEMRSQGTINDDEFYIGERVISNNISLELPPNLRYITTGQRMVIFTDIDKQDENLDAYSHAFTLGARYDGYEIPWVCMLDGRSLHGGGALELLYDIHAPMGFRLEAIPRDDLILPKNLKKPESASHIIRRFEVYVHQLRDNQNYNQTVVQSIAGSKKPNEMVEIFRIWKLSRPKPAPTLPGVTPPPPEPKQVQVGWYVESQEAMLKDYEPLDLGLFEPTPFYPIILSPYEIIEQREFYQSRGRAQRDRYDQESIARLKTAMVNGTNKAAQMNQCVDPTPGDTGEAEQSYAFTPGKVTGRRLKYFQMAYPDPMLMMVTDNIRSNNKASAGQVAFAVQNRKDVTDKTATEINASEKTQQELSAVQILGLSVTVRETYTLAWQITKAAVLRGTLIHKLLTPEFVQRKLRISAAGDIDVIRKAETIKMLFQFFPMIAGSPLAVPVLTRIITLLFPEQAAEWNTVINSQGQQATQLIAKLASALEGLLIDPRFAEKLSEQDVQAVNVLLTEAQNAIQSNESNAAEPMVANPSNAGVPPSPQGAPPSPPR